MKDQFYDEKYMSQSSAAITNDFAKMFRSSGDTQIAANFKDQISCVINRSDDPISGVVFNAEWKNCNDNTITSVEVDCLWNKSYTGKVYKFTNNTISQDALFLYSHTAPPLK